jgi:hypothetical protein
MRALRWMFTGMLLVTAVALAAGAKDIKRYLEMRRM